MFLKVKKYCFKTASYRSLQPACR